MTVVPLLKLISDYVPHYAADRPDQMFLWSEQRSYTYAEASNLIDGCASTLLDMGVKKGDRVAWYGNPTPEFFMHFLATCSIGAIWTGLNPKHSREELSYVIGNAEPKIVFAQANADELDREPELRTLAGECDADFIQVDGDVGLANRFEAGFSRSQRKSDLAVIRDGLSGDDGAFLVYTSGSSGRPKGALLSHYGENFCNVIAVERKSLADRKIICNLPINHVGAIGDICGRAMTGGGTIYFQERFDPIAMMALIENERIDAWGAVPAAFQMAVKSPQFQKADLSSVDLVAWGGAPMARDLIQTLLDKTGARYCTMGYGMTEIVGGVTYSRLQDSLENLSETIGTPDPRQPTRLWHEMDRPAYPGETGELQVQGSFVMKGYWNNPEATRAAFTEDGWFKTGDVARVRPDGNIEIVGRLSEMFKSGGYNVYPREVELALEEMADVALAAVVSVPDEVFQEVGHAFVMAAPGKTVDADGLKAHLKGRLANYKIPKQFAVMDALPMLPIGKVDKKLLQSKARGTV